MSTSTNQPAIKIRNARQHNLKNIDVDIRTNELTVVTGPSGSGKSSLVFDTLFAEGQAGVATVQDILAELEKPGRDPRPDFVVARFNDGVEDIADLREGMVLEGTVSNVAAFGAFVDVGVHQDGLVHISQLADRFVKDPHEVVSTGQVVKVTVMEVDIPRKRIGLSMRKDAHSSAGRGGGSAAGDRAGRSDRGNRGNRSSAQTRQRGKRERDASSGSLSMENLQKLQALAKKLS